MYWALKSLGSALLRAYQYMQWKGMFLKLLDCALRYSVHCVARWTTNKPSALQKKRVDGCISRIHLAKTNKMRNIFEEASAFKYLVDLFRPDECLSV